MEQGREGGRREGGRVESQVICQIGDMLVYIIRTLIIVLYRENAIAIESEASHSLTFISKRICA